MPKEMIILGQNPLEVQSWYLSRGGYELAEDKTKIMGRNQRQIVTGLVVNEKVTLPRTLRKKLRAIRHDGSINGWNEAFAKSDLIGSENEYWGYMALQKNG
ncbi:hypothetical protein OAK38_08905 [Verrucomicrobia bacterium]|nr:hypothetical protein [Verrucomicrobiota bacterium]